MKTIRDDLGAQFDHLLMEFILQSAIGRKRPPSSSSIR